MKVLIWKCPMKIMNRFQNFMVCFYSSFFVFVFLLKNKQIKIYISDDKSIDGGNPLDSQDGMHAMNMQNFNKNSNLDGDRSNPFASNNPQDVFNPMVMPPQAQHMNIGGRQPRPLLDIPAGFGNSGRSFMHHGGQNSPDIPQNPFMMNSPRCPTPFMGGPPQQQLNNFRGGVRNNQPYYRNQKGAGFRNNFRGSNQRNNW